jgi:hypothetical protein
VFLSFHFLFDTLDVFFQIGREDNLLLNDRPANRFIIQVVKHYGGGIEELKLLFPETYLKREKELNKLFKTKKGYILYFS